MALPEWTVLVLLSQRPAHGFAVSQLTASDGELGRIWRIPGPSSTGRSAAWSTPGSSRPSRSSRASAPSAPSTPSPQGRQEAERWLSTPVDHVRDIRSHLLVKLALLYRADPIPPTCSGVSGRPWIRSRGPCGQQAELDGFDAILLAWRRATAAAALGFLDEITPSGRDQLPPV